MKLQLACLFVLANVVATAQSNPVPFVNQPLVPGAAKPRSGAFALVVNGTGFVSTAVVNWNGSPRITDFISSTRLKAQINASDIAKDGTFAITVTNPAPGSETSNAVLFPVRNVAPTVGMTVNSSLAATGNSTIVGDFNNDGHLDVAVGQSHEDGTGDIQIYLGNGDGTFQSPIQSLSSIAPVAMGLGDFNNDGNLDLVASDGSSFASVFVGDGKGGLSQMQPFSVTDIKYIQSADFNADGKLDLYLSGSYNTYIYLGNGDGTFNLVSNSFTSNFYGTAAIGDFNNDGILDLAQVNQSGNYSYVFVYLGNGDGTFPSKPIYVRTDGTPGMSVNAADLNDDGILDLITDSACILLGKGDGTFTEERCGTGGPSYKVIIGDFNGDRQMDFALAPINGAATSGSVVLLSLGNGNGTFQPPIEFLAPNISTSYLGLDAGDFKHDGRLALLISGESALLLDQVPAALSPPTLSFGSLDVGNSSKPQTTLLTNTNSSSLAINIGISGADPKDFRQTNNCGSNLPPSHTCQINVTFTPQASGNRSANVYVQYPAYGSPQTVAVSGVGLGISATLTPSSLTFPLQLVNTKSKPQIATLTNTGQDTLQISNISASAPFAQTNNCSTYLSVNNSCQIQVVFDPTDKGPANGTLSVSDNAPDSPQTTALSGSATVVKLSTTGINFGDQKVGTKSQPAPVQLTNEGRSELSISQIAIAGTDSGDFSQTNNCGKGLTSGHSCTIKVTFGPTEQGQRSAQLTITDNGGGSPQGVQLAGNGT
jgi:hypothetical protein